MTKRHHHQQQELQHQLVPHHSFMIVDVESLDGAQTLSELAAVVFQLHDNDQLIVLEEFHRLVRPRAYLTPEKQALRLHIYRQVTGLSYHTLRQHGDSIRQVLIDFAEFMKRHAPCTVLARDPRMEQRVLSTVLTQPIHEVCDYLHAPHDELFQLKKYRPDFSQLHTLSHCQYHEAITTLTPPHCARNDVYTQLLWLYYYGRHLDSPLLGFPVTNLCTLHVQTDV